ncbi:aminoglycoside phosphotransferase family protein [Hyphococcus sp.]|uniref:aminoglycoside phosphotransferase family protein n=1 Tax=Hyphococcus sp. TaxID=2038636 RepID=UPI003CCBEE91
MNAGQMKVDEARFAFLDKAGWADAKATPLAGDASSRRYERLEKNGLPAILMIAPPGAEEAACPAAASEQERRTLGYNAMARLAGPNLNAFTSVSNMLRQTGLSAPEVYSADAQSGFALIEDLGDDLFARVAGDIDETTLYSAAIDALAHLHLGGVSPPAAPGFQMLDYDALALEAEVMLLLQWYWPLKKNASASDDQCSEYIQLWREAFGALSAPHAPVLRDYHAENLLWLPDRKADARVGIIDFQDALFGHAAYDIASLLEDARRDVSPELANAMLSRYYDRTGEGVDRGEFERDYAILAAQRNAKILGIFARLAKRDNKPRYLDLLPRVEAHFRDDLKREPMGALAEFMKKHFPEWSS